MSDGNNAVLNITATAVVAVLTLAAALLKLSLHQLRKHAELQRELGQLSILVSEPSSLKLDSELSSQLSTSTQTKPSSEENA